MSIGKNIAGDFYWLQLHEPVGKYRLDRLAELIDEAIAKERAAPRLALFDQMKGALTFYGDEGNWDDDGSCVKRDAKKIDHTPDFHDALDLGRTARSVLAAIEAMEKSNTEEKGDKDAVYQK